MLDYWRYFTTRTHHSHTSTHQRLVCCCYQESQHFNTPRCCCWHAALADAVPQDCPRLLINMNKVAERKQQQQQQQAMLCPGMHHGLRPTSSSSRDHSSSCDDNDLDDIASCSGFESDATELTASSSCINGCDAEEPEAQDSNRDAAAAAAVTCGFEFSTGHRDVAQLVACDAGVQQLAALLGWGEELEGIIQQGKEALEEARREWESA